MELIQVIKELYTELYIRSKKLEIDPKEIATEEINNFLKKTKNNKAPGIDRIVIKG